MRTKYKFLTFDDLLYPRYEMKVPKIIQVLPLRISICFNYYYTIEIVNKSLLFSQLTYVVETLIGLENVFTKRSIHLCTSLYIVIVLVFMICHFTVFEYRQGWSMSVLSIKK